MLNEQPSGQQRQRTADRGVCSLNEQQELWNGKFGDRYTKRNPTLSDFHYVNGKTRLEITKSFFQDIPRDATILEIGCSTGNVIQILHDMGFTDVYGIDINGKAIDIVRAKFPKFIFKRASIEDFAPIMKFDLVYTSGVLIHIHPNNIQMTINKMKTLARKWIFGFEYYSPKEEVVRYSVGCWSRDYPNLFKLPIKRQETHTRVEGYPSKHCYYLIET